MDHKIQINIQHLGFDGWFQQSEKYSEKKDAKLGKEFCLARVTGVHKNSFTIHSGMAESIAEMSGKLMFSIESPLGVPVVGDFVQVQILPGMAIIHQVLPRKSLLRRKAVGKKIEHQPLAANVDICLIMDTLAREPNVRRLERYLVLCRDAGTQAFILLSKADLKDAASIPEIVAQLQTIHPEVSILPLSNLDENSISSIRNLLIPGKTYCILGPSGVGKSTLLNHLIGEHRFQTAEVRNQDQRGRHTTTRRELVLLTNGSMIIDTPGLRELGLFDANSGMEGVFGEIEKLAQNCRFKDCSHTVEKGCSVLKALTEGVLARESYENYLKLRKEARYLEESYFEKRQRDKKFGKFCKSVIKEKLKNKN
jgi:ribosome biogenesis GTPase